MKKLVALIAALLLTLSSVCNAFAASTVTYDGNARKFIFAPGSDFWLSDLFTEFKDVMPGDSLVQKITVKNQASNKVKVNIYLRSLGSHPDTKEFLSQLRLRVKMSEDNDMSYMFDAAADQPAQLTEWVCLGTLYSGGEVNLDVILDVPVELDNQYSQQIGYIGWQFMVEELPIEDTDPVAPETGDRTPVGLWAAAAAGSAIALLIIFRRRKREEEK